MHRNGRIGSSPCTGELLEALDEARFWLKGSSAEGTDAHAEGSAAFHLGVAGGIAFAGHLPGIKRPALFEEISDAGEDRDWGRVDRVRLAARARLRSKYTPDEHEPRSVLLSQVWDWVEDHAHGISLQDIVDDAVSGLASSENPDWSPLLPLGHWAKHRDRPQLLVHVLVESIGRLQGVPVGDALLADPYVEYGQARRRIFGAVPAIASTYLQDDPKSGAPHEWRVFFEKAGALGKVAVLGVAKRCGRWERPRVDRFLGSAVPEGITSNDDGYRLVDFDIDPRLPGPNAADELRRSLAPWLADGFVALKQAGRRRASYFYREKRTLVGKTPSAWINKLSKLAWVPCDDEKLRLPEDALPASDPGREDAPVAQLPPEFLTVLDQEGLRFGTAIPEATSLRRLLATGNRLEADDLAELLSACRQQPMADSDRRLIGEAVADLTVPVADGGRVPVRQIVQRIGGRRGGLGGWIVPLDSIAHRLRGELEHPDLPIDFPETTSGEQSLDFILATWRRARLEPEGLANEVRDVLPMAYAYCLEDCTNDSALQGRWTETKPRAMVFAEREWISLAGSDSTYLDDIADRKFIPNDVPGRMVTAGHLGRSRDEQGRTAVALDLRLLSSTVTPDWRVRDAIPVDDDWMRRFKIIYQHLQGVRTGERAGGDGRDSDTGEQPRLLSAQELAVDVRVGDSPPQRVPMNARLHEGSLTVLGRPVEFSADAAKELLRHFSLGQRADLAADLTGMLSAIDTGENFRLAEDKFGRSHAPNYEPHDVSRDDETIDGQDEPRDSADTTQSDMQKVADTTDADSLAIASHFDRSDSSEHPDVISREPTAPTGQPG